MHVQPHIFLFYLHTIELVGQLVLSIAFAFPCNATAPFDLAKHTHEPYKSLRTNPDSTFLENLRKALRG